MADYEKVVDDKGVVRYKLDGKFVKGSEVPEDVKSDLENAKSAQDLNQGDPVPGQGKQEVPDTSASEPTEGTPDVRGGDILAPDAPGIREDEKPGGPQEPTSVQATLAPAIDSADDVDDESGEDVEEQDRAARLAAGRDQDEAGMGFKRVKGKTVDIFDNKTPHTRVRFVAGVMVPLSQENFENKSDGEIIEQLRKLKKIA